MVVKVYISGISGNKEVKKRQQRVLLILDSKAIKYEVIDIAEPENEAKKDFMQNNSTSLGCTIGDPTPRHALPPQIFNDDVYCGDYDQFDMANEIDEMEKFLKLAPDDSALPVTSNAEIKLGNGNAHEEEILETEPVTQDEPKDKKDENKPSEDASDEAPKVDSTENGAKDEAGKEQEDTKGVDTVDEQGEDNGGAGGDDGGNDGGDGGNDGE